MVTKTVQLANFVITARKKFKRQPWIMLAVQKIWLPKDVRLCYESNCKSFELHEGPVFHPHSQNFVHSAAGDM